MERLQVGSSQGSYKHTESVILIILGRKTCFGGGKRARSCYVLPRHPGMVQCASQSRIS